MCYFFSQVNSGHQWYMQVVYTIGPSDGPPRYKRSVMGQIAKRAAASQNPNGTNMHPFLLNEDELAVNSNQGVESNATTIASVLVVIILIAIIIVFVIRRRQLKRRRREEVRTEPVQDNRYRAASKLSIASVKAINRQKEDDDEMEMDIKKSVNVSSLNVHKQDNLNRPQVKVKKVNLEVKFQGKNINEGGTEV